MPVAAVAAIAVAGGIAGSEQDVKNGTSSSQSASHLQATPETAAETSARATAKSSLDDLDKRLRGLESNPAMANLEKLLAELGQGPSQERIDASNKTAASLFAPRQEALNQSLELQQQQFAARAAQQGRSSSDPILAAKLAQEQIRQQSMLSAEQNAFATGEALNAPGRQFQNQFSAFSGLANQAIQNRQAVFSLGSDFANSERQFRLATGTQFGESAGKSEERSGGGFKGFMTGLNSGAGAGASIMKSDIRAKENVTEADVEVREIFEQAQSYSYDYIDPKLAGRRISPMAQDLEHNEVTKQFICEDVDGMKMIDYAKALPTMFAGISALAKAVARLEETV